MGLEVGALKITHDDARNRRYVGALVVMGKINSQIVNIAARRMSGVARSAGIGTFHLVLGTLSYYNL